MSSQKATPGGLRLQALPAAAHISAAYERYLRSLTPIADDQIRQALFEQLDAGGLIKGPFLEATPAYKRGRSLSQLIAAGVLPSEFAALGSHALPLDRPLYLHQEQALLKARAGRNLVVATGTGSGKTESFLLPILAELVTQHAQGRLGSGVRALLLYPMNALANDQVKRLRATLAGTPWITFGRYTGETKEKAKDAGLLYADQFPSQSRLPNELLSREEMRANPPHLLLTNYAMLEYLLLRPQDLDLFDPTADTWRFIVVDEAHVYDGARGTEVAMLLRRLKDRVASSRVQVIATSATVGSDSTTDQVIDFAGNLFDAPFEWIADDPERQDVVRATRVTPPDGSWEAGPEISFAEIARAPRALEVLHDDDQSSLPDDPWLEGMTVVDDRAQRPETAGELILQAAGSHASGTAAETLAAENHVVHLRSELLDGPRDVQDLASRLFGDRTDAMDELAGLVDLAAGLQDPDGNPVISARYHLWVNSADAAYLCLRPGHHHGYLRERATCDQCEAAGFRGVPVWQFAACQRCSTGYIYGNVKDSGSTSRTWLALGHPPEAVDEDEDESEATEQPGALRSAWLCPTCGSLRDSDVDCERCATATRSVIVVPAAVVPNPEERKDVPPRRCVACGGYTRGLIRGLAAGPEASTSVLATAAYQELPTVDPQIAGEARKLLAFSDSRQQAAYFAPYLQGGYQKFLWRRILLESVEGAHKVNGGRPVPFDDVVARGVTLALEHQLLTGRSAISARREVASWLIAELSGTDERNSLEGTGLIQIRVDQGTTPVPRPLLALGLTEKEAWSLIEELLATVRRAGAIELPAGLDVDLDHDAFGPRRPDWGVCETDPDPKRHIAAWAPQRGTNKRQSYLERVLATKGADPTSARAALTGLWSWLTKASGALSSDRNRAGRVVHKQALGRVTFTPGGTQFRCNRCRRWATGTVNGICPTLNCSGAVSQASLPDASRDDDHYRTLYRTLLPTAMTAVEHTAQWSSLEAADIQRSFISGQVNVLSCSTTFELGVDVGELESVLLRNVPPTTANYVQRAGRAGRRGTAAALVVTFARSRPHDQAMFREPLGMIAGEMRAPYVPIDNERIARRHVHSIAMSAFFRNAFSTRGLSWRTMESFFSSDINPSGPDLLATYLDTDPTEVRQAAAAVVAPHLHAPLGLTDGSWRQVLVKQTYQLRDEYRAERQVLEDARAQSVEEGRFPQASMYDSTIKTLNGRLLLDRLATKNVLPKYGFPVDVVELKTYHLDGIGRKLELSRDLAVAIAEYAPGSQIVAGGKVIRSGGLAKQAGKAWVTYRVGTCRGEDRHFVMRLEAEEFPSVCPDCESPIQGTKALRPEFGFVADKRSESIADEPPRSTPVEAAKVLRLSSDLQERRIMVQRGPIDLKWGKRAEFAVVANGPIGRGWWICAWCGRGAPAMGNTAPKKHEHPLTSRDCAGTLTRSRLVHTFETDALAIHLPGLGFADREAVLAALLAGASDALEVPITDIGGTVFPTGSSTELVIFDTVPGGAGNAIRIAQSFEDVVHHAISRVEDCSCGLDASCYACLRHFGNQRVHERLTRYSALNGLRGLDVAESEVLADPDLEPLDSYWRNAVLLADPSVRSALLGLASQGREPPQVGLEVADGRWQLELAWEEAKIGAVLEADDERDEWLRRRGWTVMTLGGSDPDGEGFLSKTLGGPDSPEGACRPIRAVQPEHAVARHESPNKNRSI